MFVRKRGLVWLALLLFAFVALAGCGSSETTPAEPQAQEAAELEGTLVVYHAGSLAIPFEAMEKEFEDQHPNVDIQRTSGGSTKLSRQIVDLGDKVDIFASADYSIVDALIPEYADWNALFANNAMVIMYTDQSKYASEITKDNWPEILLREGVKYGHSNPDDDPCGYRSLLCWQLAEVKYGQPGLYDQLCSACPEENVRPKSVELISLLETGTLDYAFEYESVARQHAAANPIFKWVELPKKVNLSQMENAEYYAQAQVDTAGSNPGETVTRTGDPIYYGITIPKSAENPELAIEFLKYFFDKEGGLKVLQDNGQPVPETIEVKGEGLPEELQALL